MTVSRTNKYGDVVDPGAITGNDKIKFTDIGGLAVKLTNNTGGNTVKGTVVSITRYTAENAFNATIIGVDPYHVALFDACGVVLDDGVANGDEAWIVTDGYADVLLKDGTY